MLTSPDGLLGLPADWQAWVRENVARGCAEDSMLPLLTQAGFDEALCARAVQEARATRVRPEPDVAANLRLCEGQPVRVALSLDQPRIVLFDGLLSDAECDALAALALQRMADSTVVDDADGVARPHAHRSSAGAWFERGEGALVTAIEARIEALLHWPQDHGEGLQVLRYESGGEYRAHFDWFDAAKPGHASHLAQAGQRVATLILYLSEVEAGGGTRFPTLGLEVRPRKGSALFFADVDAQGAADPATLHAGLPVLHGVKLIATKWLRERRFGAPG